MKKCRFALVCAFLQTLAIYSLVALAISCNGSSSKARDTVETKTAATPKTTFIEGSVTILRVASPGSKTPLGIGETLAIGDSIETGSDGYCTFEIPAIGAFELGTNSRVTLDAHFFEGRRGALSLGAGSIRSKIERLGGKDSFILRTPSLVCGVRGTIFTTEIQPNGELSLSVDEGTVSVFPETLLANALHPAAELVLNDSPKSGPAAWENPHVQTIIDGLPTVAAGQEIVVSVASMEKLTRTIERLKDSLESQADENDIKEQAKNLLDELRVLTPVPTEIPQETPQKASETADTGEVQRVTREDYSYTIKKIPEPGISEISGDMWLRPEPVRSKTIDRKVLAPMSAKTASIVINQNKKGASGSFESGRARLKVESPDPVAWLALVSPKETLSLSSGALYLAECTAWAKKGSIRITFCISEGAVDVNGDGEAYSPYSYNIFPVDAKARRFSFLYCHNEKTNPAAQANISVGSQVADVIIQDITFTKLNDFVPRGPELQDALIPNGTFSRGFLFWEPLYWADTPPTGISIAEGRMRYYSRDKTREVWHAQLGTTVALQKGARYKLSFDMLASSRGNLGIDLFENGRDLNKDGNTLSPNAPYMKVAVEPGVWQRYELAFSAIQNDPKSRLCFSLGDLAGTTYLDNIAMTRE